MIIREWRGRAARSRADDYPTHFRKTVVPALCGIAGFVGAHLARREGDGQLEFVVWTRWQSIDSICAFAGPEFDRAVVEPGAVAALTDFDKTVRHYEVVESVGAAK
jgi:heme-degrading monooxygenase HmoA